MNIKPLLSIIVLLLILSGCASMQAVSSYARTGDTVTIALGGTDQSNALVEILKKENITITITDSASTTYPISLRRLFRVYPDYSSGYVHRSNQDTSGGFWDAYVPPLSGQWMAVVDLVDPVDGSQPTLAVGAATISVSSPEIDQTVYFGYNYAWTNGDLASVDIEILPGQGNLHELNYTQPVSYSPVKTLEPLPQISVAPNGTPVSLVGGGSFKFVYIPTGFVKELIAVPASHDPNVQIISSKRELNDGSGLSELHVMILNPNGFLSDNARTGMMPALSGEPVLGIGRSSPFKSLKFNLVWDYKNDGTTNVNDANWQTAIQLVSGQYIDMDGNQMAELTPVMNKVR